MTVARTLRRGRALAAAAALVVLVAFVLGGGGLWWGVLDEAGRQAMHALLHDLLQGHWLLLLMAAASVAGAAGAAAAPLVQRWVVAPARLNEEAQVLLGTDVQRTLAAAGAAAPVQALAATLNALAAQRDQLRRDVAQQVARASRGVAQERNRLAALMAELRQSVVVCNLDGRVLLYNQRARAQFRALSEAPALAGGAELIGLGRSIYTVFDRALVAHALQRVQQRLVQGAADPGAQFVTSARGGQLLRVQMAPVRGVAEAGGEGGAERGGDANDEPGDVRGGGPPLVGFVLMLDDVTAQVEHEAAREQQLHGYTEQARGALANLQAAVEVLDDPQLAPEMRERFLRVVRDETRRLGTRLAELAAHGTGAAPGTAGGAARWPLEEMRGADFVQAALARLQAQGLQRASAAEVDATLWLQLDSYALLQALDGLAQRLHEELAVPAVQLRLAAADKGRAHLDLLWTGPVMSTETAMGWEMDSLTAVASVAGTAGIAGGAGDASGANAARAPIGLSVRDVVQRHDGAFWFERDRARHLAFFRFLLPLAPAADVAAVAAATSAAAPRVEGRPEFFDFDLFAGGESTHALDDQPLATLAYTVFDTETTGLDPAGGDEIIQIGATRLVAGRLLRAESFDQLVNPRRLVPAAGTAIHGITQAMLTGQPGIDTVLPAFHAYAHDTVLVAHNAAFDLRFLQLKEAATGLRFEQPVLDTLLLSAVVHPQAASHRLEDIAERLGVAVSGRHTALGDALVTAEVFRTLLPLLAAQGITTLGQARAASQATWYARLRY